ncbi:MAG: hypothetical protein FWF54_03325 [Candidatus Azobacteroides sp.]|nr:hypothetical protein [Candidatus Azobacteroides sp.]
MNLPVNPVEQAHRDKMEQQKTKLLAYKSLVEMTFDQFTSLIYMRACEIMLERGIDKPFVFDKNNTPVVQQLYLYFTNNPKCIYNLNAGIIMGGKVGCGKSLLMLSFIDLMNKYSRYKTKIIHAKELMNLIKSEGITGLSSRPLFIDELGREESTVKDFGSIVKPVTDLFSIRYEKGGRTYATTNFKYDTLETYYGEFIISRMQEMMNYVVLPGESRRVNNGIR